MTNTEKDLLLNFVLTILLFGLLAIIMHILGDRIQEHKNKIEQIESQNSKLEYQIKFISENQYKDGDIKDVLNIVSSKAFLCDTAMVVNESTRKAWNMYLGQEVGVGDTVTINTKKIRRLKK